MLRFPTTGSPEDARGEAFPACGVRAGETGQATGPSNIEFGGRKLS